MDKFEKRDDAKECLIWSGFLSRIPHTEKHLKQSTTTEFSSLSRLNTEIHTELFQIVRLDEYSRKHTRLCLKWM